MMTIYAGPMRPRLVIGAAVAGLALAGCSASAGSTATTRPVAPAAAIAPAATTTTINAAAVGQRVMAILNTGSATVCTDKTEPGASGFPGISTAFMGAAQQLQALTYPANALPDSKTLVAILEKLSVDVTQAAANPSATVLQNVENDEGTELADSDALRHDLGLPAAAQAACH